ncbi:MAG: pyridoxal 5'-phosphate synthase glutaminase subunit PdxT [Fimbriimonadales bacterium]|nr:pyridoxal 5'-phosphate synthase glutaminase subunit PdxT [Fimbriimonadales bacterium]
MKVGVLALQGDFAEHRAMLARIGVEAREVRKLSDLEPVDALIIPGGESTTIGKLMARYELDKAIRARAEQGMPIYGTCAGMILLAKTIEGSEQPRLGLMDITVLRNAFGRQIDSFEADIPFKPTPERPVRGVFIRAPIVLEVRAGVEVLSEFNGKIVAVQQGNLLATAFHPELTDDERVHRYFLSLITK